MNKSIIKGRVFYNLAHAQATTLFIQLVCLKNNQKIMLMTLVGNLPLKISLSASKTYTGESSHLFHLYAFTTVLFSHQPHIFQ